MVQASASFKAYSLLFLDDAAASLASISTQHPYFNTRSLYRNGRSIAGARDASKSLKSECCHVDLRPVQTVSAND